MSSGSFATFEDPIDYIYLCMSLTCVLCAALAAGMTMGLLSLDSLKLRIKLVVGTPAEKVAAKKILPLLESHHFLLCTLLLFNAVANEALPVFLDEIVPSWAAVVIAVTAVLLCGEVLPTALFTGPNQLSIAAKFSGLVYFLQFVFYPIAMPMSLALDKLLGDEDDEQLNRDEISAMMQILRDTKNSQAQQALTRFAGESEDSGSTHHTRNPMVSGDSETEDPLSTSEVNVITGVLALAKKSIRDVFMPMEKVNMLSSDQVLNTEAIEAIDKVGHSRLPVFKGSDQTHILGFLLVKRLITVNPEKNMPLSDIKLIQPIVVGVNQSLLDVLNLFQSGHSHLALVSEDPEELQYHLLTNTPPKVSCAPLGILSIEDIFEEMLQSEIYDEEDLHKGHDQEHASMHLREISMRSSVAPSVYMTAEMEHDIEAANAQPLPKIPAGPGVVVGGGARRSTGGSFGVPSGSNSGNSSSSSTTEKKRQISISIVESNTRANAGNNVDFEGGLKRSTTLGFERTRHSNRASNHSVSSAVSNEDSLRERCLSASATGPKSFLKGGSGSAAPPTPTKITPSMVTKYIRRRKSAANLAVMQDLIAGEHKEPRSNTSSLQDALLLKSVTSHHK